MERARWPGRCDRSLPLSSQSIHELPHEGGFNFTPAHSSDVAAEGDLAAGRVGHRCRAKVREHREGECEMRVSLEALDKSSEIIREHLADGIIGQFWVVPASNWIYSFSVSLPRWPCAPPE